VVYAWNCAYVIVPVCARARVCACACACACACPRACARAFAPAFPVYVCMCIRVC